MMTNEDIANLLRHVAASFIIKNEQQHRFQIMAYQRAADTIQNTTTQIADLIKENKLEDLPGVGTTIKQHLEELVKKGSVKHFDTVMKDIPKTMFVLLDIPSFGPKKAYKLVEHFQLKNETTVINDIEKLAQNGEVAKLEGFGEKSQADIIRAIGEFRKGAGKTTRMLLPFAIEVAERLVTYLRKCPEVKEVSALGSLRRKSPTVGDVDIAVASDDPKKTIAYFVEYPYRERIIEKGSTSSSLLTSGGHQVDLMVQPVAAWGSLLQHFTGSKHHNVRLRDFALKKGLSLSEYGIKDLKTKSDERKTYKNEKDFYNAIGLDWIPPELREDRGEVEKAANRTLPRLIELPDVKGDLHIHSSYPIEPSHDLGTDLMQNMLDKAKKLNYEYLGFSEHNPSVSRHTPSQALSILQKRADYIEHIKESNKNIRILNLLEIDILVNGDLAINENALQTLDAGLVSIHSSFSTDSVKMTRRVLQGLSHPKAKILSHPTGRIINQRPGYQLDWDKIFAFCVEYNKALEINAWPERTDLPDSVIKEAIAHGVKMVINTDSHASYQMDNMQYGIWNARRGLAEKNDILNTLEYNKLKEWLEK